jgi:hypothetical protein
MRVFRLKFYWWLQAVWNGLCNRVPFGDLKEPR